jgi:hypothetical protein
LEKPRNPERPANSELTEGDERFDSDAANARKLLRNLWRNNENAGISGRNSGRPEISLPLQELPSMGIV